MPNITFSSPLLRRAVTVYADGDSSSILTIAEAHRIPIPRACGDGKCGVCAIDVLTLSGKTIGSELTAKEKNRLLMIGKITPEEIHLSETSEIAPRYRLACQYIVGHEDILVKFSGRPGDA